MHRQPREEEERVFKQWWPSANPSQGPNAAGSLPSHFSAKHCTKLFARGSVIRDISVHEDQVGMQGNKSGHQKNAHL